ncbi:hypothetical protein PUN28_019739 [Cardiocondyla obscurior]|uniref:Uncharacterized protein n=1 Tax=Cardiocondyla obscurior TaxID=286306 RepID=A0AAW2E762_9HYME
MVSFPDLLVRDATCRNLHFERPQRSEFQRQMQITFKTAKERHRHRQRNHQRRPAETSDRPSNPARLME